jgi:hypothetical protein
MEEKTSIFFYGFLNDNYKEIIKPDEYSILFACLKKINELSFISGFVTPIDLNSMFFEIIDTYFLNLTLEPLILEKIYESYFIKNEILEAMLCKKLLVELEFGLRQLFNDCFVDFFTTEHREKFLEMKKNEAFKTGIKEITKKKDWVFNNIKSSFILKIENKTVVLSQILLRGLLDFLELNGNFNTDNKKDQKI